VRQATIVAFYGEKPTPLTRLIGLCCEKVMGVLGKQFSPYEIEQMHATIVGIERAPGSTQMNLNFQRYRNRAAEMDLPGFLEYLRSRAPIPFSTQIGGLSDRDYPFTSRGQRPYNRSFSIQGDKVVVMGWPQMGQTAQQSRFAETHTPYQPQFYPSTLNEIRLEAQAYGILHAYHREPSDVDNDFYFRIGVLNSPQLAVSTQCKLEADLRRLLATEDPTIIDVGLSDLYVASYDDDTLPLISTRAWSLARFEPGGDLLRVLYE